MPAGRQPIRLWSSISAVDQWPALGSLFFFCLSLEQRRREGDVVGGGAGDLDFKTAAGHKSETSSQPLK